VNCDQVKTRLGEYLDGEGTDEQRRQLADHLARCADCAAELDQLRQLTQELRRPPQTPPPREALWRAIAERLATPEAPDIAKTTRRTRRLRFFHQPLATAASLLVTVGLGWLVLTAPWATPAGASQIDFRPVLEQADGDITAGIEALLARYGGRPVTATEAARAIHVRIHAPEALPDGLQLRNRYILHMGRHHQALAFWYTGPRGQLLLLQCPPHIRKHYGNRECVACNMGSRRGHVVRVGKLRLMHMNSEHICVCVVSTLDEQRELPAVIDAIQIDF